MRLPTYPEERRGTDCENLWIFCKSHEARVEESDNVVHTMLQPYIVETPASIADDSVKAGSKGSCSLMYVGYMLRMTYNTVPLLRRQREVWGPCIGHLR